MPSILTKIDYNRNNLFADASLFFSTGSIRYKGKTQSNIKIKTDSFATVIDVNIRMGTWLSARYSPLPGISLGTGYRYWDRAIQSTSTVSGLREYYTWNYFTLGFQMHNTFNSKNTVTIIGEIIKPVNAKIKVDYSSSEDPITLTLKPQLSSRIHGSWKHTLHNSRCFLMSIELALWRMDTSNSKFLIFDQITSNSKITEPANYTVSMKISAGLTWQ